MSGLSINNSKSRIFCAGLDLDAKDQISEILNMELGDLPVTYLGVPLCSSRAKKLDYQPLISKITSKVNAWASRKLSYAGRFELVKGVLYGVIHYWCKAFLLPKKVVKEIVASMRNFLWSGSNDGRKAPIAWKAVCKPRDEGGLGIKEVLSWNKTSLCELIYDLAQDSSSIWHTWGHDVLLRGNSIWTAQSKTTSSAIWQTLIRIRDEIQTRMNDDNRAPVIMSSMGRFDAKGLYDALRDHSNKVEWNCWIWGKLNTPRVSFTSWMIIKGGVRTKDKLKAMGITEDDICALCGTCSESRDHLWFHCEYSRVVLQTVLAWGKIGRRNADVNEWVTCMERMKRRKTFAFSFWVACMSSIMYYIWTVRNLKIFQQTEVSASECALITIKHVKNCVKAKWLKRNRETNSWLEKLGLGDP